MKKIIQLQIHSCFASFSSNDIHLYKECKRKPKDVEETLQDKDVTIYYKKDKTYYDISLSSFLRPIQDVPKEKIESLAKKYEKLGYTREQPKEIAEYWNRISIKESIQRQNEGFILYGEYPYHKEIYKGYLSPIIINHPTVSNYIKSNTIFGYFGHSARKKEHDLYLSKLINEKNIDDIADFLISRSARHMMDAIEDDNKLNVFKELLEDYMKKFKENH